MKAFHVLACAAALGAFAGSANAQILASDDFSYADGNLVPNGGWSTHSGSANPIQVSGAEAVITHGSGSREDSNILFASTTGNLYFGIDFTVDDLGGPYAGTDFEYFAHFREDGSFNFTARLDIVAPSGGGDYSVGIATTGGAADATWPTDLTYGVTYRAVVRYNQDDNTSELWIDPVTMADLSILGADEADPGDPIDSFALRQSFSSENETVRVDNLIVAQTFAEANGVVSAPVPMLSGAGMLAVMGLLGASGAGLMRRRRR